MSCGEAAGSACRSSVEHGGSCPLTVTVMVNLNQLSIQIMIMVLASGFCYFYTVFPEVS